MSNQFQESRLYVDGVLVWRNPPELGHAFIKLRKQIAEERLVEKMFARYRFYEIVRIGDTPFPDPDEENDTTAETVGEIERSYRRRGLVA